VTRLSLGIENFDDGILEGNGRAHLSKEVYRAWEWIVACGFPNVNIDLIAGMVGETWDTWRDNVRRTLELSPDSVTIYQMELPFNTVYSRDILGNHVAVGVADWPTKRAWVDYAFNELLAAGYSISSGYTVVKHRDKVNFSYRDNLWQGSDLIATGIASFGHISGVHYQNKAEWQEYTGDLLDGGRLPLGRGLRPSRHQLLVREMILQLKRGWLVRRYFADKFDVDIIDEWQDEWNELAARELATIGAERIELTRAGLLQVDGLLPRFFEPQYRQVRYT
jgi:oxygen-independent coproporphyrinogen-3 oxidase